MQYNLFIFVIKTHNLIITEKYYTKIVQKSKFYTPTPTYSGERDSKVKRKKKETLKSTKTLKTPRMNQTGKRAQKTFKLFQTKNKSFKWQ